MGSTRLSWIESAGGPLILLDDWVRRTWTGIEGPDYDLAGEVQDFLGILDKEAGQVAVFWGHPLPLAWLSLRPGVEGCFARWVCGASDESVEAWVTKLSPHVAGPSLEFELGASPAWIIDSAMPGEEADEVEHLVLDLQPGRYLISTQSVEPDKETSLVLHHIRLVG